MTLVVNLLAGPGSGKSTTAAGVFYELKRNDINAEIVPEYAKDVVWERSLNKLGNQPYILGKQHHRLWRLQDQVDVIVTDCPLFLSLYYGKDETPMYRAYALELFERFDNINFFLERVKKFNPAGRTQNEAKAHEIDGELRRLLDNYVVPYESLPGDEFAAKAIATKVMERL